MSLVVVVICLGLAALVIEALYWLVLAALFWAPPLFLAVWAMHATAGLHLNDPLAPLYAFVIAGLVGRSAMSRLLSCIARSTT